ncbi:MAG: hypothetical protein C0615_05835 [Desulfuromonas sp.]|nr:MAG: hypothetical protein C0615_05835 [Desulfuromonas sp.]
MVQREIPGVSDSATTGTSPAPLQEISSKDAQTIPTNITTILIIMARKIHELRPRGKRIIALPQFLAIAIFDVIFCALFGPGKMSMHI